MIIVLFLSLLLFVLIGVPVSFAVALSSIVTIIGFVKEVPLTLVVQRIFTGMDSFPLLCIPLFMLAGEFMSKGGISDRLIRLANIFVGRFRGGLAQINTVASMFFGGVSGSSTADVSSEGPIIIPLMVKAGYSPEFSAAITASTASLGIIIPPSNSMIIYAMAAGNVSIASMFMGGIIPGILVGLGFMVASYIIAVKNNYRAEKVPSFKEAVHDFFDGIIPMFTFIIIIGGVLSGMVTPTESAILAVLYSGFLAIVVYRVVKIKDLPRMLLRCALTTSVVLFLIGVSSIFGWILAYAHIPQIIAEFMFALSTNKYIILLMIFVLMLLVGTFMDAAPALIIFVPIFLPIVQALGVHPIHFGLIMITTLAIGGYTPPVGVTMFIACKIANVSVEKFTKAAIPLIAAAIVVGLIIIFIPQVTLYLPSVLLSK